MSGSKGSERVASLLKGAGFPGDSGLGQQLTVHPSRAGFSPQSQLPRQGL